MISAHASLQTCLLLLSRPLVAANWSIIQAMQLTKYPSRRSSIGGLLSRDSGGILLRGPQEHVNELADQDDDATSRVGLVALAHLVLGVLATIKAAGEGGNRMHFDLE